MGLILISVFEIGNVVFDDYLYFRNWGGIRLKVKNEKSQEKENNFDVLVLGGSYGFLSIKPSIIEEKTGLSCYNFCTYRIHSILSSYFILKNYLRSNSKPPRFVLICFQWDTAGMSKEHIEKESLPYFFEFVSGHTVELIEEFGFAQGLTFLIPCLKRQYLFKKLPLAAFEFFKKGEKAFFKSFLTPSRINLIRNEILDNQGYWNFWDDKTYRGPPSHAHIYTRFTATPFFEKYVRRMLNLAQQNGSQVLYLVPTTPPDVQEIIHQQEIYVDYLNYLISLNDTYQNMRILYPQSILNRKDFYNDQFHLNKRGADVLGDYLAEEIKKTPVKGN